MNISAFRLLARGSVSSVRTLTCSVVSHSLKMPRSSNIHKCFKSSSTFDRSKLSNSISTDDFDFEDSSVSELDVVAITNGDPDKVKALELLRVQVDIMKLQELAMPSSLSTENWKELLTLPTNTQRRKLLNHLWVQETRKTAKKEDKRLMQESYKKFQASKPSTKPLPTTSSPIEYSLSDVFLFQIIRDNTINQLYNYKLLQAEWFGPHIILDCGYDSFMSPQNLRTCATEMKVAWAENRENFNPFDIFFCNLDPKGPLWPKFAKACPSLTMSDCPVHHTHEHYLKFFPKEKLVYLTPHCNEVLEEYNPEDIYIIGAYVDFGSCEQLSLAKAKKEGLRKAKLPLDQYLKWKQGTKSLTTYTVLAIMNELKDGQSWPDALKRVPRSRVEYDMDVDNYDKPKKMNRLTAESIRESHRQNLVYDLLLHERFKRIPNES